MMRIARHTDYAARLLLHLCSLGEGQSASIAEIAEQRLLPLPFIRRMVARLVTAGLLTTTRGKNGGIQLGRSPAEITLADVVMAMEGTIALNDCVHLPDACPFMNSCPVQKAWTDVSQALTKHLASITFAALMNSTEGHAAAHAALKTGTTTRTRKPRAQR
jgi:Rrf2 family protein